MTLVSHADPEASRPPGRSGCLTLVFRPGAWYRARSGRSLLELGPQPTQTFEVVEQAMLGIDLGAVTQYAHGSVPPALRHGVENLNITVALPERDDVRLGCVGAYLGHRAIEIQRQQVRLHEGELVWQVIELWPAVMKVEDDADVRVAAPEQAINELELVGGFAEPAAVVVEADADAQRCCCLEGRFETFELLLDSGLLLGRITRRLSAAGDPEIAVQPVPGEQVNDALRGVVEAYGHPPATDADPVTLHRHDLILEVVHVLAAPVIDIAGQAQPLEHVGSLFGVASGAVEGHDAPGEEVVDVENRGHGLKRMVMH